MSQISNQIQNCVGSLLNSFVPEHLQSDSDQTKEALLTYKLALNVTRNALNALKKGTLSDFDALVSDRSCHVRAAVISQVAQEVHFDSMLDQKLKGAVDQVQQLVNKKTAHISLNQLIEKESIPHIQIDKKILLLAQAYLLNTSKSFHPIKMECSHCHGLIPALVEKTQVGKLLGLQKGIEDSTLKEVVEKTKTLFSQACVLSLQNMTLKSQAVTTPLLSLAAKTKILKDKTEIGVSPAIEAMLQVCALSKTPLLIKSMPSEHIPENPNHQFDVAILGSVSQIGQKLQIEPMKEVSEEMKKKPAIVIEGQRFVSISQINNNNVQDKETHTKKMLNMDLYTLITANAACHPQFSDNSSLDEIDELIGPMKELGLNDGLCHENQKLYSIFHIYTNTIENELKKMNKDILVLKGKDQ